MIKIILAIQLILFSTLVYSSEKKVKTSSACSENLEKYKYEDLKGYWVLNNVVFNSPILDKKIKISRDKKNKLDSSHFDLVFTFDFIPKVQFLRFLDGKIMHAPQRGQFSDGAEVVALQNNYKINGDGICLANRDIISSFKVVSLSQNKMITSNLTDYTLGAAWNPSFRTYEFKKVSKSEYEKVFEDALRPKKDLRSIIPSQKFEVKINDKVIESENLTDEHRYCSKFDDGIKLNVLMPGEDFDRSLVARLYSNNFKIPYIEMNLDHDFDDFKYMKVNSSNDCTTKLVKEDNIVSGEISCGKAQLYKVSKINELKYNLKFIKNNKLDIKFECNTAGLY